MDAAFERGERSLGTAVIGLAFTRPLAEASPRILRAMRLPDAAQRQFAFTAAGVAARLHGELTPELTVRINGHGDTITRPANAPDFRIFQVGQFFFGRGELTLDGLTVRNGRESTGAGVHVLRGNLTTANSDLGGGDGFQDVAGVNADGWR